MSTRPTSSFGWLDHSDEESRRVQELLRAFEEKGTLDAIGIGTIRDALANTLFPGLSTLHTRARYFLFIPWIYSSLEDAHRDRRVLPDTLVARARAAEVQLIDSLMSGGARREGIIGRMQREKLKVLSRDVYWGGLRRLGILLYPAPSRAYLDGIATGQHRHQQRQRDDDGGLLSHVLAGAWDPGLPDAPEGLLDSTTFGLSPDEAAYLLERIVAATDGSLLAELARRRVAPHDVPAPWALPEIADVAPEVRAQVSHAECFSVVIWGAQILYSQLLVQALMTDARDGDTTGLQATEDQLAAAEEQWHALLTAARPTLAHWDRAAFWVLAYGENPRIPTRARLFADRWIDEVLRDPEAAMRSGDMHRLIEEREAQLKGGLARLWHRRARERSEPPYGLAQLTYRWGIAVQMLNDLADGLHRAGADA